ncbi:S-adenosyl-L-methionine-dependent methyltransferase [Xylaria venustula]|nr:S-adenosyl-L-methionine-dependent methyltransferase [Xylaria venustula]
MGKSSARDRFRHESEMDVEEAPTDPSEVAIESRVRDSGRLLEQGLLRFDYDYDNSEEREQDEVELIEAVAEVIDLTTETSDSRRHPKAQPIRNPSLPLDVLIKHYDSGRYRLEPGSTVEIKRQAHPQLFKTAFLYIQYIIDTPRGVRLRGIPLTRVRNLRGRVPKFRNEVAMILHTDSDDMRPEEHQGAIELPVNDAVKVRNCHFTNADFPEHPTNIGIYNTKDELEEQGVLMCRWRCIFKYKNSETRIAHLNQTRKDAAPCEYSVEHLNAKHTNKKRFRVSESSRFNAWRGWKVRGGEHDPENESSTVKGLVVHLDGDSEEDPELLMIEKKPGQRYTFGDMFCGAGGASCGAQKAGFQVTIACDHHNGACKTYSKVFPGVQLYQMDVFDFIQHEDLKIRLDIIHLSPPCQFWSPAHTVNGVNDDANIAALFACREIVRKCKPRLFTLEQTYGILNPCFEWYFNSLIHGFTENNYSIRWKIVDLVDWGSPATRRRLIVIGSCPGEDLPPFPEPTHSVNGSKKRGRKPHVTVKKMLERIPRDASQYDDMHQPHEMVRKSLERWDPDVTLTRCITTNGGCGNYHPNGRRDFTLREYATLQTFPVDYPFFTPDRKRQIGNAFPPMAAKVLYTHLRKWLENKDRVYATENEPLDTDDPNVEYVDLEDDFVDDDRYNEEDIEYVDSHQLSSPSTNSTSTHQSDGDYSPVPCIDPNQRRRVRPTSFTQDYVDLTEDDDA